MAKTRIPRPIRRWTAIKLEHLEAYLKAYAKATQRAGNRYYIDAFAGSGDCILSETGVRIEGSARRALKVNPPFSTCFFVEKDPVLASHLENVLTGHRNASVFQGDCNEVIPREVLPKVPRRAPSLAFLDQTGAQLHWATVRALAAHRLGANKMELLILYAYDMFIARWLRLPAMRETLDAMFGGNQWKRALDESLAIGEDARQRRERFVNLYCDGLRSLDYKYVDALGPLFSGRRPLYHVIFASDHPVGVKIMRDVWSRPRPIPGELWYGPQR